MNRKFTSGPRVKAAHLFIWMIAAAVACLPVRGRCAERQFIGIRRLTPPRRRTALRHTLNGPKCVLCWHRWKPARSQQNKRCEYLSGSPTQLSDLLRLRLVRDDHGLLRIGFAYFTAHDINKIHAVAAKYVPSLKLLHTRRNRLASPRSWGAIPFRV